ncbi:MAG: Cdc6/Cdc18 family protein [Candidatus Methanomethylophilaceae archaeon]|jgi:cell division control protein 6
MFDKASAVIRDMAKLSFEYVPEKLVHREGQMSRLEMYFRPLAESGRPCYALLMGNVGTGKTATAKRFCEDMAKHCSRYGRPIDTIFVNCRNRNTEAGVILELIRHFDRGFPERGFSPDEMMRSFTAHIESGGVPVVIVLDEVDVLLKKSNVDLIYQLTRFSEGARGRAGVSLILISQHPIYGMLDKASISTFGRGNAVTFDKYTRGELYSIAKARAEESLIGGRYSDDVIELIADVSSEFGDARFAIELLRDSAVIAEGRPEGSIDIEDVREAKANINSVVTESKLTGLDTNRKLALLAIARSMKSNLYVSITAAEKTYAVVCEEYGQEPRKHTQFWTYIQDMDRQSLLETVVRSEKEGGRSTYISLPDIPSKVLAKKLEALLEGKTVASADEV